MAAHLKSMQSLLSNLVAVIIAYCLGVGKLFTRRARFGKTVEAAGRTLIGKQGEDLFFFFFGDHSPRRANVISEI